MLFSCPDALLSFSFLKLFVRQSNLFNTEFFIDMYRWKTGFLSVNQTNMENFLILISKPLINAEMAVD